MKLKFKIKGQLNKIRIRIRHKIFHYSIKYAEKRFKEVLKILKLQKMIIEVKFQ